MTTRSATSSCSYTDGELVPLLSTLQLGDTAFPTGRYALSHGLEELMHSGFLRASCDPVELLRLLVDMLRHGVAPSDGAALACAHDAFNRADTLEYALRVDNRLTSVKLAREGREASARTGRALLATATEAFGDASFMDYGAAVRSGSGPGNYAVILGLVSAALGVQREHAVAGDLFSFCMSWSAAAVRLGITDHRTAQVLLHQVKPTVASAARRASTASVSDIRCSTPFLDLMSMRHEHSELRIFAT
jgi:urease accessory protein